MIKAAGDDRAMFYSGIGGGIRKSKLMSYPVLKMDYLS